MIGYRTITQSIAFVAEVSTLHIDEGLEDALANPNKERNRSASQELVDTPGDFDVGFLQDVFGFDSTAQGGVESKVDNPHEGRLVLREQFCQSVLASRPNKVGFGCSTAVL
jgi:hypothetical protein